MILDATSLIDGYRIPKNPSETVNINLTGYTEFDLISSYFRKQALYFSIGPNSDEMTCYRMVITGFASIANDLDYYKGSKLFTARVIEEDDLRGHLKEDSKNEKRAGAFILGVGNDTFDAIGYFHKSDAGGLSIQIQLSPAKATL